MAVVVEHVQDVCPTQEFATAVKAALASDPIVIPTKFLYSSSGSLAYRQHVHINEMHYVHSENRLLHNAELIHLISPSASAIVEFGAGDFSRTERLFTCLRELKSFTAIDISADPAAACAKLLSERWRAIRFKVLVGDYECIEPRTYISSNAAQAVLLWLGNTFTNQSAESAITMLSAISSLLTSDSTLVVAAALREPLPVDVQTRSAFETSAFIEFRSSSVRRMRDELGIDIEPDGLDWRTEYNQHRNRVESYFTSPKVVHVISKEYGKLGVIDRLQRVVVGYSYCYSNTEVVDILHASGWRVDRHWQDDKTNYCLFAARNICGGSA